MVVKQMVSVAGNLKSIKFYFFGEGWEKGVFDVFVLLFSSIDMKVCLEIDMSIDWDKVSNKFDESGVSSFRSIRKFSE